MMTRLAPAFNIPLPTFSIPDTLLLFSPDVFVHPFNSALDTFIM